MITETGASASTTIPLLPSLAGEPSAAIVDDVLQRQIYDLVRERVLESIGVGGNWTVGFRRSSDTDTFFSDTMADMIAWDVVARLTPPVVPNRARLAG